MGKKSKRNRGKSQQQQPETTTIAPSLRTESSPAAETKNNLQFEDPFVDVYEDEEDEEQKAEEQNNNADELIKHETLNPYHATTERMEMDPAAYKMHSSLRGEWPSLSFDFVRDSWGEGRTRFPHQLLAVVGTQADKSDNNSVQIWKLSDLGKIPKVDDDVEEDRDYDAPDDKDDESSEEEFDHDPILEHTTIAHSGGINRIRTHKGYVATWSDVGAINLYTIDVEGLCMGGGFLKPPTLISTYEEHSTEGYALDFSSKSRLATGDNDGNIHVFQEDDITQDATPMYTSPNSVEDIQWSPTETTVFAAGEAGGLIKIYDTRAPNRVMLEKSTGTADVNALSWSKLVTNLMATGCEDGKWSVWDLRKFEDPLARFTCHTTPITSMEWHPTDESMLVVSDDVGSFVYDLSVEEEENDKPEKKEDLPPQLLFVHSGSPQTKEVHWHPQITSCLMSTAYDGFHTFIPSNL